MATEEFLPALSRAALEKCAIANDIAPQARVKDTRAAVVARFNAGTFVYPEARFAPTAAELEARRNPASLVGDADDDADDVEDGGNTESLETAGSDPDEAGTEPEDRAEAGPDNEDIEIDDSLAAAALDEAAYAERTAHSG
jgi:ParB family chromosome partitioning protein